MIVSVSSNHIPVAIVIYVVNCRLHTNLSSIELINRLWICGSVKYIKNAYEIEDI